MRPKGAVLAGLALVAVTLGLVHWYMLECEGQWDGPVLEDSMGDRLTVLEELLRADVSYLADTLGPRNPPHHEELEQASRWIQERWRSHGYQVGEQGFLVEGAPCSNLEIEIPGRVRPDEIVIVTAQYDTWLDSPGANNNGSGMAVLLQLSDLLKDQELDRTLRLVAFTTQEPPYSGTEAQGSRVYAQRSFDRGEDIRVMLSMDAIGIYKHGPGSQQLPFPFSLFYPDRGDFLGFIANLSSRQYVVDATRGFKKGTSFPIQAGSVPWWVKGASWSDHASFWRLGYPGIQVTDTGAFRSPATHTTDLDTIENLDFEALARITIGMYASILELTTVAEG
jgi:hypothetical protein